MKKVFFALALVAILAGQAGAGTQTNIDKECRWKFKSNGDRVLVCKETRTRTPIPEPKPLPANTEPCPKNPDRLCYKW